MGDAKLKSADNDEMNIPLITIKINRIVLIELEWEYFLVATLCKADIWLQKQLQTYLSRAVF